MKSIIGFSIESIVFCNRKIDSIVKKIKSVPSIFLKDRQDRFTHGGLMKKREFITSTVIKSTTLQNSEFTSAELAKIVLQVIQGHGGTEKLSAQRGEEMQHKCVDQNDQRNGTCF